ncbi:MAG: 16S rRNA (guanine(527)-N(7))-methyltransferase RsmG [Marinosulfonomonas sp.]|nr:16S rRNA (guanine(527)-N(7))-methyltransferase RsmG [Marinosulfonomonas sp.]
MTGATASQTTILERLNVSRETIERLEMYEFLLQKWNPAINLVGKSTLANIWERHFLDSAQIFAIAKQKAGHWVDIGTGGGFPGAVVAAMAVDAAPELRFTFVESDLRKATFLRTVTRELGLNAETLALRIEDLPCLDADILSARALASLPALFGFAELHLKQNGQAIFMKGNSFKKEMIESLEKWSYQSDEYPSITDGAAVILSFGEIRRV